MAGVVSLGADAATRKRQESAFLDKVQKLMGQAVESARNTSEKNMQALEKQANSSPADQALRLRSQAKAYQSGNAAAMATIAQTSPSFGKVFGAGTKSPESGGKGGTQGSLRANLARDLDAALKSATTKADSSDAVFAGLGPRCKEAAKRVEEKLKAAKAGSDEARYLGQLRDALQAGASSPAEAVRTVRGLSGVELAVVLRQLGVQENK